MVLAFHRSSRPPRHGAPGGASPTRGTGAMDTGRIDAFSDGVLAIVITIMVLGLVQPEAATFESFFATTGLGLLSYLLSFVYVGIYWNNHHHMFQVADRVDGRVL